MPTGVIAAWIDRVLEGELWTHSRALVPILAALVPLPPKMLRVMIHRRRRAAICQRYHGMPLARALRGTPWWVRLDIAEALTGRSDRDVAALSGVSVRKLGQHRHEARTALPVTDAAEVARVFGLSVGQMWTD